MVINVTEKESKFYVAECVNCNWWAECPTDCPQAEFFTRVRHKMECGHLVSDIDDCGHEIKISVVDEDEYDEIRNSKLNWEWAKEEGIIVEVPE